MHMKHEIYPAPLLELVAVANSAVAQIPPLFPLESSVAVNPFLGQSQAPLPVTAARLARVAGTRITPDRSLWAQKIRAGEISQADIAEALAAQPGDFDRPKLHEILTAVTDEPAPVQALPTVAQLAADLTGRDWPALIEDRIGVWAASYFDRGQALWPPSRAGGAFRTWREFATRDLTPEIHGLRGFGAFVSATNRSHWRAIGRAAERLGVSTRAADTAFHRWLIDLGGWAQYARYLLWQAELNGATDSTAAEVLAIRMVYDEALFLQYHDQIAARWTEIVQQHETPLTPNRDQVIDAILQEAAERAQQRRLAGSVASGQVRRNSGRAAVQAVFCIDVRSEVFRRALEAQDRSIETLGFAGFFGLASAHRAAGSDVVETRGPALLQPVFASAAVESPKSDLARRYSERAKRAWGRFKQAAVSSFAFVEATGPIYAAKLLRDGVTHSPGPAKFDPAPQLDPAVGLTDRVSLAKTILGAMSLTRDFAPIVLVVGHGADVTNNPHESALHCGACGGHAGDVNARLLARLLNDPQVRDGLRSEGIDIPDDTLVLAALHHTTTDQVTLFDQDHSTQDRTTSLQQLRDWLNSAGHLARTERAARLPRASSEADITQRATDWAELRPEWGLAGCRAFIAAPRDRTEGTHLDGRCFLHSYDWRADDGFDVLELILTAPVVVASWISLQYYGSTVAPRVFGGGNKLLHNVVGGIGVVEGNGGPLRPGLPWQSVHDGERLQHDPLRLTVIVEAPREAMSEILGRHPAVRALFDNRWLHLIAMDDKGRFAWRYDRNLNWSPMAAAERQDSAIAAE